ncbi:MAG: peptidoglycan DL-endopeptidase CwlO [Micromonosporaceae bacterium]|nr:peptidoglycan DL-endopeptidase CwlO [Micromonosporaceae bacterium]
MAFTDIRSFNNDVGLSRTLRAIALRTSGLVATTVVALVAPAAWIGPSPAHADPDPADLDRQVAAASQRLETVIERFNTIRENQSTTQTQLADVQAQLAPLARQIDGLRRRVETIAVGAYVATSEGPMNAVLGASSPGTFVDRLTMLEHIARHQQRDIDVLRDATDRYDEQRSHLAMLARQQELQSRELQVTQAAVESDLASLRSERAAVPDSSAWAATGARGSRQADRGAGVPVDVPVSGDNPGGAALRFALQQLGKNYQWAAAGPNTYDCSGLVMASWRDAGRRLPHSAAMQWASVRHIQRSELSVGDLVFYFGDIHHVALYAGNGRIIEAPRAGQQVSIRQMDFAPIHGYGRVG